MKTYLVGGAVRDELLGLPVKERDWVVVGATPDDLLKKGFKPVGKDFPVFLHPKTHDEYALARTERKTSAGYKGFECYFSPEVTLGEDLKRRDLTVNAIAKDEKGNIIDPYHGQEDLKKCILRHVSDAFSEDPVRILRIARFASRFGNFTIAPETLNLMKKMVKAGEVDALIPERVWLEFHRALEHNFPQRFIEVLRECGALKIVFPEIDALFGVPNPPQYHPEIDTGIHTLIVLQETVKLTRDPMVRFAAIAHDMGKTETPKEEWPRHYQHCELGVGVVKRFCHHINTPRKYQDLAILVTCYHMRCHKIFSLKASTILEILNILDPFRKPKRFQQFLLACEADTRGRLNNKMEIYEQAIFFNEIYEKCSEIDVTEFTKKYSGSKITDAINQKRLEIIKNLLKNSKNKAI